MTDAQKKQKSKVYGLRYRMKKKGYHFAGRANHCTMKDFILGLQNHCRW